MKFALLSGAEAAAGASVLTDGVKKAIENGLANLNATASDVILLVIPVTIGVIALSAGINYAIKKIKGVLSKAS